MSPLLRNSLRFGLLLAVPFSGLRASEVEVSLAESGLQAVAISFFAAVPVPGEQPQEMRVRYGDLTEVVWAGGAMPTLDAHVLLANATPKRLLEVTVRVSLFLGHTPASLIPPPEEVRPGSPAFTEKLLFERDYVVESVEPGSLARVTVPGIQMRFAIADLMRQKLWPSYLRAQAVVSEPSGELKLVRPEIGAVLKVLPPDPLRRAVSAAASGGRPGGSGPPEE